MNRSEFFLWNIKQVNIMRFRNNQCVPHVQRANIEKRHDRVVFVEYTAWGLFSDDFTEYAIHIQTQISHTQQRFIV